MRPIDDGDQGYSLIELLVVVVIIGILAAIAIPTLMLQRRKAVDASIRSDLRTVAVEVESYGADHDGFPSTVTASTGVTAGPNTITVTPGQPVRLSSGNVITYDRNATGDAYCLFGTNSIGTLGSTEGYVYVSSGGGLSLTPATGCPASY